MLRPVRLVIGGFVAAYVMHLTMACAGSAEEDVDAGPRRASGCFAVEVRANGTFDPVEDRLLLDRLNADLGQCSMSEARDDVICLVSVASARQCEEEKRSMAERIVQEEGSDAQVGCVDVCED